MHLAHGPVLVFIALSTPTVAQHVEVESFVLDNGMEFLLVERTEQPNSIAAGWVAKVGSVNERPGITGISHFFEHMMFKGTRTIGTRDADLDAEYIAGQEAIKGQLNELIWTVQYQRFRRGEIDDPWNAANDTDQMRTLRAELRELAEKHRDIIVKDEYSEVYTKLGGSSMNAFTSEDLTFYFVNVPSNKFELWAWMESDRLYDSVFREFYAERDVVHEERRLRTESTPTGKFREQFNAMFWQSSPYAWPVIGWPSDLNSYTRKEAQRYFNIYYRPNNLVGVVVGDFQASAIKPIIREYFGRLSRGEANPPAVVTLEVEQRAQMRMDAQCDCQPQVEVRYHTVPFGHVDSFALELMAEVLNGRTGRLYKAMVEGQEIASSASAGADGRKYAGAFSFRAQVKGDADPPQLEEAWYEQLARLQEEPVPQRELQKVKNRIAANAYRRLQSNFFLLIQLGLFEGIGGWEYINESPAKLQAVTTDDITRIANTYFDKSNRAVALYTRKAGLEPQDVELAALDAPTRDRVQQQVNQLLKVKDLGRLQMMAAMMEGMMDQVPPDDQAAVKYVVKKIKERIAELESSSGN
ncbi:MAG: pitrilysin family protein [Planctomycetota bacterium]|nr:pitrilysin family protein [Planctomycetota bacterium]MCZ6810893.1 pitrilysin family protein [Planctomycetota bacterium]